MIGWGSPHPHFERMMKQMKHIKEFLQREYISEIASSLCLIAIGIIYTVNSSDGTFLVFALTIGIFILIGSIAEYRKLYHNNGTEETTETETHGKHCA